jgi:hypothetical protein
MSLTVKADVIENRLYFKLSKDFAKEDIDKLYTDVTFLVADLTPGYDVIADFSECDIEQIKDKSFKKISNYLIVNGLGEVVRVIDGNSLLHDLAKTDPSLSSGFIPVYAKTHEEAKETLKNSTKRNGIRFYVNNIPVKYSTSKQCGTGQLANISIGGFSVQSITQPLSAGEEFIMKIIFVNEDFTTDEFSVKAKVIRGDENSFAGKFIGLNSDQKEKLWKCLIAGSSD